MKDDTGSARGTAEVVPLTPAGFTPISAPLALIREQDANCLECPVRSIALFSGLSISELDDRLRPISNGLLRAASTVYREGESADAVFTIRHGVVQMVDVSTDGDPRTIRMLGRGAAIGLEALDSDVYEHTAIAMRDVNLCRIPSQVLRDLQARSPRFTAGVIKKWHEHASCADVMIGTLNIGSLNERVRALLRLISDVSGDPPDAVRLPRRLEMARILGVSMESVSRCMAELSRRGLLARVAPWTYRCDPSLLGRGTSTPRDHELSDGGSHAS